MGGLAVKLKIVVLLLMLSAAPGWRTAAGDSKVIPLSSEPHHHLALHNDYVNLYQVQVKPHDSVLLHRHDYDAISVMLAGARVTVRAPGKPDVHQDLEAAQVRLQPKGYVHQTAIEDELYRNVTVELLQPQRGGHNLCAQVMAGQPLHCDTQPGDKQAGVANRPQFATEETTITLSTLPAGHELPFGTADSAVLVIALDPCALVSKSGKAEREIPAGGFVWRDKAAPARSIRNAVAAEARLVSFVFKSSN